MVGEWKGRGGWKRKEKKRGLGGKRDRERQPPEWPAAVRGDHLQQCVADRQGAHQQGGKQDAEVEVEGGGHSEDSVWGLVAEVDHPRPAVEDEDVLYETYDW